MIGSLVRSTRLVQAVQYSNFLSATEGNMVFFIGIAAWQIDPER
jgi:hypothetical protein